MTPDNHIPVARMSNDEAISLLSLRSKQAIENKNLSIIFSNNEDGRGKSATGNFSLIGKVVGLSSQYVSRVLRGKMEGSVSVLKSISKATGVPIDDIIKFIDSQKEDEDREAA